MQKYLLAPYFVKERFVRHSTNKFSAAFIRIMIVICLFSGVSSCDNEEDPHGPESALGESFTQIVDGLTNSFARSVIISADGSKILAVPHGSNAFVYSSDGGATFSALDNAYLNNIEAVDNQGTFYVPGYGLYRNNTFLTLSAPGQVILGDNGKVFSYDANWGKLYQKNVTDTDFNEVTLPIAVTPGSGGYTYYAIKAMGKGILFIAVTGYQSKTLKTFLLDEGTLQWSEREFTFEYSSISSCAGPATNETYSFAGRNILIAKGCSGLALFDLSNGNKTFVNFPEIEGMKNIGDAAIDNKGQLHLIAGAYSAYAPLDVYVYDGSSWTKNTDIVMAGTGGNLILKADADCNLYYNSGSGAGESLAGLVKFNAQTGIKTGMNVPTTNVTITDAALVDSDELLLIAERKLLRYDISSHEFSMPGITDVSHVNVLSDGRWVVGGVDRVLVSHDHGATWTETKNIFSSVNPARGSASVIKSRMINGQLLLLGTFAYKYDNLSLGITQDKYDNIAVHFDGTISSATAHQYPSDFITTGVGPDETIYGYAYFVTETGSTPDYYEVKQNIAPVHLNTQGEIEFSPQIITDDNIQMSIKPASSGTAYEVVIRKSSNEEWQSSSTELPGGLVAATVTKIIQSNARIIWIYGTDVYLSE